MKRILLVEAGGSKTDWVVAQNGQVLARTTGAGLNPNSPLRQLLPAEAELLQYPELDSICYYGAGVKHSNQNHIRKLLDTPLPLSIKTDLDAAVDAFGHDGDAIYCLLGTGSQSVEVLNGQRSVGRPSLGYLISDEGSGYAIGRALLQGYIMHEMPVDLRQSFGRGTAGSIDSILTKLYSSANPRDGVAYVASLARWAGEHMGEPWVDDLIRGELAKFVTQRVACYAGWQDRPIFAVGGIAAAMEKALSAVLSAAGGELRAVLARPMDGLVAQTAR